MRLINNEIENVIQNIIVNLGRDYKTSLQNDYSLGQNTFCAEVSVFVTLIWLSYPIIRSPLPMPAWPSFCERQRDKLIHS